MREMLLSTPVTGIFICLAAYELGVQINKKLKTPIANPMLIGIVLAAAVLKIGEVKVMVEQPEDYILTMFHIMPVDIGITL